MVLAALLVSDFSAYRTWTCVTPVAVNMAPAIAISCNGPASWDSSPKNPHLLKRFKVWVNNAGKAAMAKPYFRSVTKERVVPAAVRFPVGTVIVKEKYDAATWDGVKKALPARPELLTIMVKGAQGSKPATGDWSYYVADALLRRVDGSQESRCASCHAAKKVSDFTFRGYGRLTR